MANNKPGQIDYVIKFNVDDEEAKSKLKELGQLYGKLFENGTIGLGSDSLAGFMREVQKQLKANGKDMKIPFEFVTDEGALKSLMETTKRVVSRELKNILSKDLSSIGDEAFANIEDRLDSFLMNVKKASKEIKSEFNSGRVKGKAFDRSLIDSINDRGTQRNNRKNNFLNEVKTGRINRLGDPSGNGKFDIQDYSEMLESAYQKVLVAKKNGDDSDFKAYRDIVHYINEELNKMGSGIEKLEFVKSHIEDISSSGKDAVPIIEELSKRLNDVIKEDSVANDVISRNFLKYKESFDDKSFVSFSEYLNEEIDKSINSKKHGGNEVSYLNELLGKLDLNSDNVELVYENFYKLYLLLQKFPSILQNVNDATKIDFKIVDDGKMNIAESKSLIESIAEAYETGNSLSNVSQRRYEKAKYNIDELIDEIKSPGEKERQLKLENLNKSIREELTGIIDYVVNSITEIENLQSSDNSNIQNSAEQLKESVKEKVSNIVEGTIDEAIKESAAEIVQQSGSDKSSDVASSQSGNVGGVVSGDTLHVKEVTIDSVNLNPNIGESLRNRIQEILNSNRTHSGKNYRTNYRITVGIDDLPTKESLEASLSEILANGNFTFVPAIPQDVVFEGNSIKFNQFEINPEQLSGIKKQIETALSPISLTVESNDAKNAKYFRNLYNKSLNLGSIIRNSEKYSNTELGNLVDTALSPDKLLNFDKGESIKGVVKSSKLREWFKAYITGSMPDDSEVIDEEQLKGNIQKGILSAFNKVSVDNKVLSGSVIKLFDLDKMFPAGSENYKKVNDIISNLVEEINRSIDYNLKVNKYPNLLKKYLTEAGNLKGVQFSNEDLEKFIGIASSENADADLVGFLNKRLDADLVAPIKNVEVNFKPETAEIEQYINNIKNTPLVIPITLDQSSSADTETEIKRGIDLDSIQNLKIKASLDESFPTVISQIEAIINNVSKIKFTAELSGKNNVDSYLNGLLNTVKQISNVNLFQNSTPEFNNSLLDLNDISNIKFTASITPEFVSTINSIKAIKDSDGVRKIKFIGDTSGVKTALKSLPVESIDVKNVNVSGNIKQEVGQISKLTAAVDEVIKAIDFKNDRFIEEQEIVANAVRDEIDKLNSLKDAIDNIDFENVKLPDFSKINLSITKKNIDNLTGLKDAITELTPELVSRFTEFAVMMSSLRINIDQKEINKISKLSEGLNKLNNDVDWSFADKLSKIDFSNLNSLKVNIKEKDITNINALIQNLKKFENDVNIDAISKTINSIPKIDLGIDVNAIKSLDKLFDPLKDTQKAGGDNKLVTLFANLKDVLPDVSNHLKEVVTSIRELNEEDKQLIKDFAQISKSSKTVKDNISDTTKKAKEQKEKEEKNKKEPEIKYATVSPRIKGFISDESDIVKTGIESVDNFFLELKKEIENMVNDIESTESTIDVSGKRNGLNNLFSNYKKLGNRKNYLGIIDQSDIDISDTKKLESLLGFGQANSLGAYEDIVEGTLSKYQNTLTFDIIDEGKLRRIKVAIDQITDANGNLKYSFREVGNTADKSISGIDKLFASMGRTIGNLSRYFGVRDFIFKAFSYVREGIQFVSELDKQLTVINQTMKTTSDNLEKMGRSSVDMAKNLGSTASNVMSAAAIYANANETAESVLNKARPTVLLSNAAGSDIATASNQLQAVVNQFDDMEGKEYEIVNAYEKISAGIAMDFQSGINTISEGVSAAGAVANEAGLEFNEFGAIVAKIAEQTRNSGSSIGNAMKTIMARLSRSKSADDEVSDEDRSNTSKALGSVGISVYNNKGEYRDINDTLSDLASKWDTLTDAQRNYIAEQSAGVRNINVFNTLMKTYAEAMELANDTIEDANFADITQEVYMDSLIAKTQTLKASLQGLFTDAIDVDLIKNSVTGLNFAIDSLDALLKMLGNVNDALFKMVEFVGSIGGSIGKESSNIALGITEIGGLLLAVSSVTDTIREAQKPGGDKSNIIGKSFVNIIKNYGEVVNGAKRFLQQLFLTEDGLQKVENGTKLFDGSLKDLAGSFNTARMAAFGFIAVGTIFTSWVISNSKSATELRKSVDQMTSSYVDGNSEISKTADRISSLKDRYNQLSSALGNLTDDELSEYHDITNQIADEFPALIKYYDDNGNAVLNLSANFHELNEELERTRALNSKELYDNLQDIIDLYNIDNYDNYGEGPVGSLQNLIDDVRHALKGESTYDKNHQMSVIDELLSIDDIEEFRSRVEQLDDSAELTGILSKDYIKKATDKNLFGETNFTDADWKSLRNGLHLSYESLQKDLDTDRANIMMGVSAVIDTLRNEKEYSDLGDNVFDYAKAMINGSMEELNTSLGQDREEFTANVATFIDTISDPNIYQSLNDLDNLKYTELELPDLVKQAKELAGGIRKSLSSANPDIKSDEDVLKIFGFGDLDGALEKYNGIMSVASEKFTDKTQKDASKRLKEREKIEGRIAKFVKQRNIVDDKELDLLMKAVNSTDTLDDAFGKFIIDALDIVSVDNEVSSLNDNLKTTKETIEALDKAFDESISSSGLTAESITAVKNAFESLPDSANYDYDKLFEYTAEGVRLNKEELERLNEEYIKFNKEKYSNELVDLKDSYADLCIAIAGATDETERNRLVNQRDEIAKKIDEVQELSSRYDGLTNSVTRFLQTQGKDDYGASYDKIVKSAESIKEIYDKGGTGSRDLQNYTKMFLQDDINTIGWDNKDWVKAYEKAVKYQKKYITEDQKGSVNFLNYLTEQGMAKKTGKNTWKDIVVDIEEVSKRLGVSTALITEQFEKLKWYGFDLDFTEDKNNLSELKDVATKSFDEIAGGYKKVKGLNQKEGSIFGDIQKTLKEHNISLEDTGDRLKDDIKFLREYIGTLDSETTAYKDLNNVITYLVSKRGEELTVVEPRSVEDLNSIIKKLNEIKGVDLSINWNSSDVDYYKSKVEDVKKAIDYLRDGQGGKLSLDSDEVKDALTLLDSLNATKNQLSAPTALNIDISTLDDKTQKVIQNINDLYATAQALSDLKFKESLGIDITSDKADLEASLQNIASNLAQTAPDIAVQLNIAKDNDGTLQEDLQNKILALNNSELTDVYATLKIDQTLYDEYKPDDKDAEVKVHLTGKDVVENELGELAKDRNAKFIPTVSQIDATNVRTQLENITSKPIYQYIYTKKVSDGSDAYGQNNRAFARGVRSASNAEFALTGELGPELRVSKDGYWELLGANGAEFNKVHKDDIIFDAEQTKELLKNGYLSGPNSRGKAYADGTYSGGGTLNPYGSGSKAINSNKKKSGSNKDKDSKDPEKFDWIEVMIDRIERKIQHLDTVANSVYRSWTVRNENLTKELSKVREEIDLQTKAQKKYDEEAEKFANKVNLPQEYRDKVRNGKLNLEEIQDEDLAKNIKSYQELVNKALDCADKIDDLQENLGDLAKQSFENVVTQYDEQLNEISHRTDMLNGALELVEARGNLASQKYFNNLLSTESETNNKLREEYKTLQKAREDALKAGDIAEGSEAWHDMTDKIREVEKAIQDSDLALLNFTNDAREADWAVFEKMHDYISEMTNEASFLQELLTFNEKDLIDKVTGGLTDKGLSSGALSGLNYDAYMNQADQYAKKIKEIDADLAKDPSNSILIDKKYEYVKAQQDAIKNANSEKKAVQDLIRKSYEAQLDILQKIINKRKEDLEAQKDVYEYSKTIEEKTKNIASLQKRLGAYEGDNSEETQSLVQKLKNDLADAEEDLRETEYDRWLNDQTQMLDDFYSSVETAFNLRLDDIDGLFTQLIDDANKNAETINTTVGGVASGVGYELNTYLNTVFGEDGYIAKGMSELKGAFLSVYQEGGAFITQTNAINSAIGTAAKSLTGDGNDNNLSTIIGLINSMVKKSEADYEKNTNPTSQPAPAKPAASVSTVGTTSGSTTSSGTTSSSSSSGSSASKSTSSSSGIPSFFIKKKDSYPKNKLNKETSIVDRLKWWDFDSSFDARKKAYEGMGLKSKYGNYSSSAAQNIAMLNWMKQNKFAKGGQLKSMIGSTGEDGLYLGRANEFVITQQQYTMLNDVLDRMANVGNMFANNGKNVGTTMDNTFNMTFQFEGVKDYNEFITALQSDNRFEKIIQSMTVGRLSGNGNSLNKFKY